MSRLPAEKLGVETVKTNLRKERVPQVLLQQGRSLVISGNVPRPGAFGLWPATLSRSKSLLACRSEQEQEPAAYCSVTALEDLSPRPLGVAALFPCPSTP